MLVELLGVGAVDEVDGVLKLDEDRLRSFSIA